MAFVVMVIQVNGSQSSAVSTAARQPSLGIPALRHVQNVVARRTRGATSLQGAARELCRGIYDELRTGVGEGTRAAVLVRCFKTHPLHSLGTVLQALASEQAGGLVSARPDTPCMVLIASAGDEAAWNRPEASERNRIVVLTDAGVVARRAMLASLLQAFEVGYGDLGISRPASSERRSAFNIFHVESAVGNAAVPDQAEFVTRYGIQSVLGFGGPLRHRDLYAVLLFARAYISADVAQSVRSLALDVTSTFFRFGESDIFDER